MKYIPLKPSLALAFVTSLFILSSSPCMAQKVQAEGGLAVTQSAVDTPEPQQLRSSRDNETFTYNSEEQPYLRMVGEPDGSTLELRDHSDENKTLLTTLSDHTVVRDPKDGFHYYAVLSDDGSELVPTSQRASSPPPVGLARFINVDPSKLRHECGGFCDQSAEKHALVTSEKSISVIGEIPQEQSSFALNPNAVNPTAPHVGLVIIVGFPDDPNVPGDQSYIPRVEGVSGGTSESFMDKLCNHVGFNTNENTGSIYDYYKYQSNGLFEFTNVIAPAVMLDQPWSYYENISGLGNTSSQILKDAVDKLAASGYTIPANVTRDPGGRIRSLSVLYAGNRNMLNPHATSLSAAYDYGATGDKFSRYMISFFFARPGETQPTTAGSGISTMVHEMGHLLFLWPDLYDTDFSSKGLGDWCLMAYGISKEKDPASLNPQFRIDNGWATVTDVGVNDYLTASLPSTGGVVYRINNPFGRDDSFLVENIGDENPYNDGLPDKGIAIWHVDPSQNNNNTENEDGNVNTNHYYISLVQADNEFNLEKNDNQGDSDDLFDLSKPFFNASTTPSSRFWFSTLSESAPIIEILGNAGPNISVRFGQPPYELWVTVNGLSGGDASQSADVDVDGLSNLLEFAIGTNPNVSDYSSLGWAGAPNDATPGNPVVHESPSGNFTFRFMRRKDHGSAGSVSYAWRFSSNLTDWESSADTPSWLTTPTVLADDPSGDYELVEVISPSVLGEFENALFFQIEITPVP